MRGALPAKVFVLAEAPGEDEDILAQPLVGRSGQLWWEFLEDCLSRVKTSLTIKDFAVDNLVACVPWNDQHRNHSKYRQPSPSEMEACRPRLIDTLKIANPRAVITLGTPAKQNGNKTFKQVWNKKHYPAILHLTHPAHWIRTGGLHSLSAQEARLNFCMFLTREREWLANEPVFQEPKRVLPKKPTKPATRPSGKAPKSTALRTRK